MAKHLYGEGGAGPGGGPAPGGPGAGTSDDGASGAKGKEDVIDAEYEVKK
jgi:hypothetical protein